MKMSDDSGILSIDFLVGFTIFIIAFIWVVSMIPGLLINLQGYTIDSDAVAYRTGVILAEDPGEPTLPLFPWETLVKKDVVRFGLAVSKDTPNILSRDKVNRFFCSSVFSYPDDYQQRVIFGDYPFRFNISLIEVGSDQPPRSVGDVMSGNYGSIRRLVKIKEPSYATINASSYGITGSYNNTAHPDYFSGENETVHEFSILINNTELLYDKVSDPIYQIDPARERITINITDLNQTMYPDRNSCFNISLTNIYAKDPALIRIRLFSEPVIDGVPYSGITTEPLYATLPPVKNNISLTFDPSFVPWSNYPQIYVNLTFNLTPNSNPVCVGGIFSGTDPVRGSRFLNNTFASPFGYNYSPGNVMQPQLRDAVLEVSTGSGYRTVTGPSFVPLAANFKYEILSGAPTFTVKFTDLSTGSPVDWEWDFTNDTTIDSILNNPTHDYILDGGAGIYNVNLTVKDTAGASAPITKTIDLSAPVAGFNTAPSPATGTVPLAVTFTDTSTGGAPSTWDMDFGDGSTHGSGSGPWSYTYTVAGSYTAKLTVSNIFGSSSATNPVTVIPPAPVASFSANVTSGITPLAILFTDTSTGGAPTTWDMDFGDGSTHGSGSGPWIYTYTVAGSYTANLTVSNAGGSSSATKLISVGIPAPVASFSANVTSGITPLAILFTDTSTGGAPTTWDMDFGDGSTHGSGSGPWIYTYTVAGSYTANLTVSNAGGSSSATKTITVNIPAPVAAFSGTPVWGLAPLNVQFNDASTGAPTSWKWEYKNVAVPWTQFSTAQNPLFSFPTGTYDIRLTATNAGGSNTATMTGYIKAYSVRSFTASTTWTVPANITSVDYLVVAGGGGGGGLGGGGGAGGFRTGTLTGLSGSQTVTVGTGGAGSTGRATSGGNSRFGTTTIITAAGGGGGGGSSGTVLTATGRDGGSGGGAARGTGNHGTGNTPAVTPSQGNDGGLGLSLTLPTRYLGGGGGGASAVGANAVGTAAGNGGAGTASSITGAPVTYAGGGGGGGSSGSTLTAGSGGAGGGGNGSVTGAGTAGTVNTGGGGGGSASTATSGGRGGSGIVIIRYY